MKIATNNKTTSENDQKSHKMSDINKLKEHFPLNSFERVIKLFRYQIETRDEPDLSLISICLGFLENSLCNKEIGGGASDAKTFPVLDYETFDGLYKKFKSIVSIAEAAFQPAPATKSKRREEQQQNSEPKVATREKVKKINDVIWNSLLRSSPKDKAHLQSIYSYLTGNKLDSFGVALVMIAACQLLKYNDIHLCISEDHTWVCFGKADETMEITWHGKVAEDKRGQSVEPGIKAQTWLYLAGHPIKCNRYTEVAAMVLSVNPHLSSTTICSEMADLQQQLLWILYDAGHLQVYPMGIGSLGELEEFHPTPGRTSCEQLYEEAIQSAVTNYKNHHVYPYSYKGIYHYRHENFRDAFRCWADAGDVIRLYNYSRDDEDIYKEFLDIANELIPQIMKTESSGHSAKSILRDPHCFANLLRFYDGICQWEEGSSTPILHIGWAKQLCYTISKFDYDIRSQVKIIIRSGYGGGGDDNNNKKTENGSSESNDQQVKSPPAADKVLENVKSPGSCDSKQDFPPNLPSLEELTVACGEKILNPDFLLGVGVPAFTEPTSEDGELKVNGNHDAKSEDSMRSPRIEEKVFSPKDSLASPGSIASPPSAASSTVDDSRSEVMKSEEDQSNDTNNNGRSDQLDDFDLTAPKKPIITLKSRKMRGLKELLIAEKLNTNAISLQITAQSHIGGKKSRGNGNSDDTSNDTARPKRSRRE